MYKLLFRPVFFCFDPEKVHEWTFKAIKSICKIPFLVFLIRKIYVIDNPRLHREIFGLSFKNPVGLAAGFDKDAKLYEELSHFGFGFVEIGTLTPKPQPGNPKKRLFRLVADTGIINRMGFNNEGVKAAVQRLNKHKNVIVGGNIGKNKMTANDNALDDYLFCLEKLYPFVDYFALNVSSPNTPGLRSLQDKEPLRELLKRVKARSQQLQKVHQLAKPRPVLLKIAPDLTNEQLLDIIEIVISTQTDGVIATNTTLSRENLQSPNQNESGGLSGKPLTDRSTEVIRFIAENSKKAFPIIGVGGIHSADDAMAKLEAGADLVQLYTGFIYEGPGLIKKINRAILAKA
ncbi:MAG: quinone-dependent dihydroorotate dehydrogenase [Flavobacteriaceae bacterium]|nr:quinone-dependent dihydroorotate dehydrogenase [Flavobacteriaceae bacterium]